MKAPWYIVADDFTGAGDSAVQFREEGRPARLVLNPSRSIPEDRGLSAVAFDSESRNASGAEAYERVLEIAAGLRRGGADRYYKKIDSTLRGNVAEEIAAMLAGTGLKAALVCPAAPRQGRSVVGGRCLVGGRPIGPASGDGDRLDRTGEARVESRLASAFRGEVLGLDLALVRSGPSALAERIERGIAGGIRAFVADAELLDDLRAIAAMAREPGLLLAGSSGLAEALAASEGRAGGAGPAESPAASAGARAGDALFVVGSITPTSLAQCSRLEATGLVSAIAVDCGAVLRAPDLELGRLVELARGIPADRATLLRTEAPAPGPEGAGPRERGPAIARFLGVAARELALLRGARSIFASGGDTAARVAEALGLDFVDFADELSPGVPFGGCASRALRRDLSFVCKSGGFGSEGILVDVLVRFAGAGREADRVNPAKGAVP